MSAFLHRCVNPVVVKELRAAFRGSRYLIAHMIIVSLAALGMFLLLLFLTFDFEQRTSRIDSSYIGQIALHSAQVVHLAVVLLVVPAFAATAISTERERETLDLMIATGLRARQIVIGKFLSAMALTGLLFVALMPIVALCFLFGGVSIYQIVANYALMALLSALLVLVALAISAASPGTARAVITTYVACVIIGGLLMGALSAASVSPFGGELLEAYGVMTAQEISQEFGRFMTLGSFEPIQVAVGAYIVPGYVWLVVCGFFFLLAVNRLKPSFANQSTGMRIYYVAVAIGMAGVIFPLVAVAFGTDVRPDGPAFQSALMVLLILSTISCMFAIESPFLPPHLRLRLDRAGERGWHRWMFHPGSRTGAAFVMTVNGAAVALLGAWCLKLGGVETKIQLTALGAAVGVMAVWLWFACGLAALLSGWADRRPLAARIVFVITIAAICVVPSIHAVVDQMVDVRAGEKAPETVAPSAVFSPVVTLYTALELPGQERSTTFKMFLPGWIYLPVGFALVMGSLGFLLNGLAARRYWRREAAP